MTNKITILFLISKVVVCFFCSIGFAQSSPVKLIAFSYDDSQVKISKWDAGATQFTSSINVAVNGILGGSSTFDANLGKFYAKVIDNSEPENQNKLFTYTTFNDEIAFADVDSFFNGGTEVDMATGYVYTYDGDGLNNVYMNEYNPVTGISSNLGYFNFPEGTAFYPDSTCYDSNSKQYYFLIVDSEGTKIVTVQVDSQPLAYTIVPLIAPEGTQGNIGLEFSNTSNTIFTQYLDYDDTFSNATTNLGTLNPQTGVLTSLINIESIDGYVLFNRTFDQETESLFFITYSSSTGLLNLAKFDTVNLTFELMSLPEVNIVEMEADNYEYAVAKYGSLSSSSNGNEKITIYPNPATTSIFVSNYDETTNYYLTDALGKIVLEGNFNSGNEIDVSSISKGFYFFNTKVEDTLISKKIIIR